MRARVSNASSSKRTRCRKHFTARDRRCALPSRSSRCRGSRRSGRDRCRSPPHRSRTHPRSHAALLHRERCTTHTSPNNPHPRHTCPLGYTKAQPSRWSPSSGTNNTRHCYRSTRRIPAPKDCDTRPTPLDRSRCPGQGTRSRRARRGAEERTASLHDTAKVRLTVRAAGAGSTAPLGSSPGAPSPGGVGR